MSRRETSALGEVIFVESELCRKAGLAAPRQDRGHGGDRFCVRLHWCNRKARKGERYKLQGGHQGRDEKEKM